MLVNLRFVLVAFLISAALFTYIDYKLMHWSSLKWGKDETPFASSLAVVSWAAEILFLVVVVGGFLVGGRETLFGASIFGILHFTAAALLIGNLSFAVASHAFPVMLRSAQMKAAAPPTSTAALTAYRVVVVAMWVGLIAGGVAISLQIPYSVIVTEYAEIGLFVAYWLIAVRRDWAQPMQAPAAA